jgi:hypothetical protein
MGLRDLALHQRPVDRECRGAGFEDDGGRSLAAAQQVQPSSTSNIEELARWWRKTCLRGKRC